MDDVAVARQLVRIVAQDRELPKFVTREAASLEPMAASKPGLVCDRLEALRQRILPDLALKPPTCDYARCVSVESFWRHHLRPDRRDFYASAVDYRRYLEAQNDPAAAARRDLPAGILVPAAHSWMVPAACIDGLDGWRITSRLRMFGNSPPYLVLLFPVHKMKAAGVEVREPRGVDVVPGRFVYWAPGDVHGEKIDKDIPLAALQGIEWRS